MKKNILGIDINESFLAFVVLSLKGKEKYVTACNSVVRDGQLSLSENLSHLLEGISLGDGPCVCGIPLADISIRNLTVPFADKKKINQVLLFELEDQLLTPVSQQVVEYVFTNHSEGSSNILISAIEKEKLRKFLDEIARNNIHPDVLLPRLTAFAHQVIQVGKADEDIIFIDAGQDSFFGPVKHAGF